MSAIKNIQEPLLSLNEVAIIPSKQTKIHSRTRECNARMNDGKLPVFVSPMNSIINEDNFELFDKDCWAIYPRTVPLERRIELFTNTDRWVAFGLDEIRQLISNNSDHSPFINDKKKRICIDMANGHMEDIVRVGTRLRDLISKDSEIMIGNIANPRAYNTLAYANFADWVRVGIGGGSPCTTSVQTGVHYPMASLIDECHYYKATFEFGERRELKIIADGGIGDSGDICKALALGADAVMCGRFFVSVEESASPMLYGVNLSGNSVPTRYKAYWGMSTKRAQRDMGGEGNKNSEGIQYNVLVECTLAERVEQIESAIRSSMSYCNAYNLNEFRINAILSRISPAAFAAYQKPIQNV